MDWLGLSVMGWRGRWEAMDARQGGASCSGAGRGGYGPARPMPGDPRSPMPQSTTTMTVSVRHCPGCCPLDLSSEFAGRNHLLHCGTQSALGSGTILSMHGRFAATPNALWFFAPSETSKIRLRGDGTVYGFVAVAMWEAVTPAPLATGHLALHIPEVDWIAGPVGRRPTWEGDIPCRWISPSLPGTTSDWIGGVTPGSFAWMEQRWRDWRRETKVPGFRRLDCQQEDRPGRRWAPLDEALRLAPFAVAGDRAHRDRW